MGGKSGGGPTETTTNTSNLPEYAQPFFEDIMMRAQQNYVTPYQQYGGQRIASFNPAQQYVQNQTMNMDTPEAFQQAQDIGGVTANQMAVNALNPSRFRADTAGEYMDPYMQNVVNAAKRESNLDFTKQMQGVQSKAAQSGTLGGYRNQLVQSELMRNQQQQLQDIQDRGLQQAYGQGMQQFNVDRTSDLTGLQSAMGAAGNMASLGGQEQTMEFDRLRAQGGVGDALQSQQQRILDVGASEQDRQVGYETAQLGNYSNILRGTPVTPNTTTTTTGSGGNVVGQALGTGLAGLSMYNQFRGA